METDHAAAEAALHGKVGAEASGRPRDMDSIAMSGLSSKASTYAGIGAAATATFLAPVSASAVTAIAGQLTTGYWLYNGETPA